MNEPVADDQNSPKRRRLKRYLGWLDISVSLKVLFAAAAVVGLAVALVVAAGGINVSADKPDSWLANNLLHFVFKRSEASRGNGLIVPKDFSDPSRVQLAAQHFDMVCANCHGRPGFGQSVVALSMSPRPQYLPKVLNQFTDTELYSIVEHGVKFSGMPSWPSNTRGDEVWSMVAFLRRLPTLDAQGYRNLTAASDGQTAQVASDVFSPLRPANARHDAPPADEFLDAAPSSGFADQTVHQNAEKTCARCHGVDGSGAVTGGQAPNLTLQDASYLQASLEAYTTGARKSGFMQNIAAQLSEAQIASLAQYYSSLDVKPASGGGADAALIKRGESIATQGIPQSATPACVVCHESSGSSITGAPHIAGQSAVYLRRELGAMRQGGRGHTLGWNPMPAVAHDLSPGDIAALAAYYSQLAPAKISRAQTPPTPTPAASPAVIAQNAIDAKAIFANRCVKCHGQDGRGDLQGDYPNLTLQSGPFVKQNLYAFHSGVRPSEEMFTVTQGLSFEEMNSLAAYVNNLAPAPALTKPNAAAAARGAALARNGNRARGIPACINCHDAHGVEALALIPRLQGQNVFYLRSRLDALAQPYAANLSALNPMPSIASKLTQAERADLAAFFAATPALAKTTTPPDIAAASAPKANTP